MASFEQLMREHDTIARLADAVEDGLDAPPARREGVFARRQQFCNALIAHLAIEDAVMYPLLRHSTHAATAEIATRFEDEYRSLKVDLLAYLAQWTPVRADADWLGFVAATRSILAVLRRRIADENNVLYPTALAASAITLRAA